MSGKWKTECTYEVIDQAGIRICPLCHYLKNPADSASWQDADKVELNFLPDSLVITQDGRSTIVPWTRNPDNHSFSFTFNNTPYHFRMFIYGKHKRIIEGCNGLPLVLEKVD